VHEADRRHQQQGRVHRVAAVVLHEGLPIDVPAITPHVGVDGVAYAAPALDRTRQAIHFHRLDAAVEGHPAHHA